MRRLREWMERRRKHAEWRVMTALADGEWHSAYDLRWSSRVRWARLYSALDRLMEQSLAEDRWETPVTNRWPRRRLYRLVKEGSQS